MKKLQKGFTLIELLVVIAIIGILSSIVLASLSSARTKGEDAAIISTLSNMRVQAELYYSSNGSYGTVQALLACDASDASDIFGSSTVGGLKSLTTDLIKKAGGVAADTTRCTASSTAWAVSAKLKSDSAKGTACVDSTGQSVSSSTAANAAASISAAGVCL